MPLTGFHPVVARWFAERLGEPTAAQRSGGDFELDLLLRESLAGTRTEKTRVLYVSPLKALSAES